MSELIRLARAIHERCEFPAEPPSVRLDTIAVIGGGHTGRRIAAACLAFARVLLIDPDAHARAAAALHVRQVLRSAVRAGELSRRGLLGRWRQLEILPAWPRLQSADLLIECVPEDLALKRELLVSIEPQLSAGSVWATNTSALRIAEIAVVAARPERVLGMHHILAEDQTRLIEMVVTPATGAAALAAARTCAALRGIPVLCARDAAGFYTTRVLSAYLAEALLLLQEGWSVTAIDDAAHRFGFLAGPFRLLDRIGLDVAARVAERLTGRDDQQHASAPLLRLLEAGCLGRKSGSGFYLDDGWHASVAAVNPLARVYEAPATPRNGFDLRERLALAVVSEAARALHKRIVASRADADIGAVLGLGFPAATGGPLRFAERRPGIAARLHVLADLCGPRYRPVPLLEPESARI